MSWPSFVKGGLATFAFLLLLGPTEETIPVSTPTRLVLLVDGTSVRYRTDALEVRGAGSVVFLPPPPDGGGEASVIRRRANDATVAALANRLIDLGWTLVG